MPTKKKQRSSSLQPQEQAIKDFLDNISDDEETITFLLKPLMMKTRSWPCPRLESKEIQAAFRLLLQLVRPKLQKN